MILYYSYGYIVDNQFYGVQISIWIIVFASLFTKPVIVCYLCYMHNLPPHDKHAYLLFSPCSQHSRVTRSMAQPPTTITTAMNKKPMTWLPVASRT